MKTQSINRRARLGTAVAALALAFGTLGAAAPAVAQPTAAKPAETVNLSKGTGTLVRLSEPMSDVFVANDQVADVQVRSSTQLYVFGKGSGETTVYATAKNGRVVYAANVRVGNNISSVGEMLHLAMPEASVQATPMNNLVLLTGTVANPEDVAEAQRLVQAYVGSDTQVVSRLRSATPLQVMLKVRIAEINRSMLKKWGINLLTSDPTGGFKFGAFQGQGIYLPPPGGSSTGSGQIIRSTIGSTFGAATKFLGLDLTASLDIAAQDGLVSILAEPNLTALSGETASFLAGGEFPVPVSQALGSVTIEYKQYGVGLAFTPIVLGDGRISMRVRPEVSELSNENAVTLNGFTVPALTTRRAETTVELGSGQSMMIGGLLRSTATNNIDKAPFLGDLPILGSLFRSTQFRRNETELVVIVTPYLVRPVSTQLATPVDGYRVPNDLQRDFGGQSFSGVSGSREPTAVPAATVPAAAGTAAAPAPGFKL
ncbi:type II and III secretion system protein family protein [Sphingomonas flavescens]|uniref:type II and III secretion system protein family protein n=1 Tax=Sphingomonas flavescens TaxID=3132797 RepID=UPI002805F415|nr:type II and III secretion system protein family protein [Sphingomonas limnosediminicola]